MGWLVGLIGVPLLLGMLTPISLVGLLGTEWPDWPELHARVIRGEALQKLSVRGNL